MAAFLSSPWAERLAELGAELPENPGATWRVHHVVTGGPDGEVAYTVDHVDGQIREVELGAQDGSIGLTSKYPAAVGLLRGDLDANAQFMSGKTKVTGSTGELLAYLAYLASPACVELRQTLAQDTDT